MNIIKVLIADDEKHARNRLKDLLSGYKFFSIADEAENSDEVIQKIIQKKPDVAFLDINMPGVSIFKTISSLKKPPLIIFQTAHKKFAARAFGINAVDYLLKPISPERFKQAVDKILIALENGKNKIQETGRTVKNIQKISVKIQGTIKVIPVEEIYKIAYEQGVAFVYTHEERFMGDKYLNHYEKILSGQGFYRLSRNVLVNIKYISLIHPMFKGNYEIELVNKDKIKLSRRKAPALKKLVSF